MTDDVLVSPKCDCGHIKSDHFMGHGRCSGMVTLMSVSAVLTGMCSCQEWRRADD